VEQGTPDTPNCSEFIYRLVAAIEAAGVRVDLHAHHLEAEEVCGRCHYPTDPKGPLIEINEPSARMALMVVAHEWGHYISWEKLHEMFPDIEVKGRETLAYILGWEVLSEMSAPITRDEWDDLHADIKSLEKD